MPVHLERASRLRKKALRLWAWADTEILGGDYPAQWDEAYSCARDCQRRTGWDLSRRRLRGCTLQALPKIRWDVDVARLVMGPTYNSAGGRGVNRYHGRLPDPRLEGVVIAGLAQSPTEPWEDPRDGCPGGWYRSPYVDSVAPYTRRRTETGGRVQNPRFDSAPWQVQDAVLYYEREQERWFAYRDRVNQRRREARDASLQRERTRAGRRRR